MSKRGGRNAASRNNVNNAIKIHEHDILSGRGVNIAQYPGNERFRALVNSIADANYCQHYTSTEKKALALEIIEHLRSLKPPARFLKKAPNSARGLKGPWEELAPSEAVKKTLQALRDCNRNDRVGYAANVAVPKDVKTLAEKIEKSGLTKKQYAEKIVATTSTSPETVAGATTTTMDTTEDGERGVHHTRTKSIDWQIKPPLLGFDLKAPLSPGADPHTQWTTPATSATTPTTTASSGAALTASTTSLMDTIHHSPMISDARLAACHNTPMAETTLDFDDPADNIVHTFQADLERNNNPENYHHDDKEHLTADFDPNSAHLEAMDDNLDIEPLGFLDDDDDELHSPSHHGYHHYTDYQQQQQQAHAIHHNQHSYTGELDN